MGYTRVLVRALLFLAICGGCISPARHHDEVSLSASTGTTQGSLSENALSTARKAIHAATVGGAAGEYIRNQMDKQAAELNKQFKFGHAQRIDEGILVTVPAALLFKLYGASLRDSAQKALSGLAGILNKYHGTDLLIEGHTDTVGSEQYNLELSKRQAEAVGNFLIGRGVAASRLKLVGFGGAEPLNAGHDPAALEANRRIEIVIFAGAQLKAEAGPRH